MPSIRAIPYKLSGRFRTHLSPRFQCENSEPARERDRTTPFLLRLEYWYSHCVQRQDFRLIVMASPPHCRVE